jgi:catenin alpha
MSKLPEEKKHKIMEQVEKFQDEKLTFDREVDKWDDHGNDIVALAKYMCIIMMQMTDFIRQRGPLKSTADVIHAAKNISTAGTKLDKLTRQIAEQCPESSSKKDLLAYIERVALYSHQINIIAKVKADVQNTNEDLIVASVESATSLIENAKNLMNAVVLTVKASYVASTKYSRQATSSTLVVWKMKAPKKKPLVRLEKPTEVRAIVRKASQKKPQNPVKVLSEFHTSIEIV